MEAPPLASLSLTHVHYVSTPHQSPHPLPPHSPLSAHKAPTEPSRSHLLPLRLARARPSNPLRHLRHPNMVNAGSRDPPHVRRTNGLRGAQLSTQEIDQGREAETYVPRTSSHCARITLVPFPGAQPACLAGTPTNTGGYSRNERQRLRHALLARPIPRLLLHLPLPIPPNTAQPAHAAQTIAIQPAPTLQPPTPQPTPAIAPLLTDARARRRRRAQSHIPQLSYTGASVCGMYRGGDVRGSVVWGDGVGAAGRVGGCGVG